METTELSNYQLYEILQNERLGKELRAAANNEFKLRAISEEEIKEIILRHDRQFIAPRQEPLGLEYKILLILIPFFWVIHALMSSKYLARGQNRKWREYWLFFCIGLVLWTVVIIVLGKQLINTG